MTINDIARLAGVSIATVSRVINQKGYVKEETRRRVEEVIAHHEIEECQRGGQPESPDIFQQLFPRRM